ncbi:hypothetical protein KGY14_15000 [Ameyamaea chiangmaiensis]|uniref:Uncharacterized protein n=3 Tax=Acetobacteraceae TaxID=433 RepID=A0A850PCE1_9PROT|nr:MULTISPECIES: hypothetical protein [Acetobacteraceae]MBB2199093.1 hypothetical protein [Gluconacetobacter dulcium]MBS4076496.1 hypothetical protein [Ameyamaea chiangmaiensis]NVN39612.1 hypothetical protein [Ameyamaea chiangmaiensis]
MSSGMEDIVSFVRTGRAREKENSMFGPFMTAASEPAIAHGMLAFQLTGSPLHALMALLGHALSSPQVSHGGENDDA